MRKATTLIAIAGSTTPANSKENVLPKFAPITKIAIDKKIVPDNIVPNPTKIADTTILLTNFLSTNITIKKAKPVITLSTTFGIKPAGTVVNKPDKTPVASDNKNVPFTVGNKRIPINIIVNMKSGLTPCTIPGVTT